MIGGVVFLESDHLFFHVMDIKPSLIFFFVLSLDLQLEVSNLTLNGMPEGKDSKDVTVFQHKTGKSFGKGLIMWGGKRTRGPGLPFFSCSIIKKLTNSLRANFLFGLGYWQCSTTIFYSSSIGNFWSCP